MFSENCFRSSGFRLRAYTAMKTYCQLRTLRYCPFTLASLRGRRKKGRGRGEGEKRKREKGGERVPSLSSHSPSPFFPSFQSPALYAPATQATPGRATLWRIPLLEVFTLVCKIRYTHSLIIPDYFVGSSAVEKLKSTVLFQIVCRTIKESFVRLQSGESLSIRSYYLEGGFNWRLYSGKATFWRDLAFKKRIVSQQE